MGNFIGIILLLILTGNSCEIDSVTEKFFINLNPVSNRIISNAEVGNTSSGFDFCDGFELDKNLNNKFCGTIGFPGSQIMSIDPKLNEIPVNRDSNSLKNRTEFPFVYCFYFKIKNARQGGNMKDLITTNSISSAKDNIIISASERNLQIEGSSSHSSNTDFDYHNTVTDFPGDILPSSITFITFKNPAGVTLTGKLTVINELYMLAGNNNNKCPNNLTLSNTAATATANHAGYSVGSFSKSVSSSSGSCLYPYGNSTMGCNITINMITQENASGEG
jgi:hypothetical protein